MFIWIFSLFYCYLCHSTLFNNKNEYHRKEKCFLNTSIVTNNNNCFGSHRYGLLVTSLGGSGTHYITCLLQDLNLQFDHERIHLDGAIVSNFDIYNIKSTFYSM